MLVKRKISYAIFLVVVILSVLSIKTSKVNAETHKVYTINKSNTRVYSDSGLTNEYGWIYSTDEVTIMEIQKNYCYVSYPLDTGGTKSGYISTDAILTATGGYTKYASANIITYCRADTSLKYGYIEKGDKVVVLGTYGNYTQVRYPVSDGYKFAFITTYNANKYLSSSENINNSSQNQSYANTGLTYAPYTGVNYENDNLSEERKNCLRKAQRLATIQWVCPADFSTWKSSKNKANKVKAVDGTVSKKFIAGKTYIGVPYSMSNHSFDDEKWWEYVNKGFITSEMETNMGKRKNTTAKGIDCSYLTYLCFNAAGTGYTFKYQTTANMLKSSYYQKKKLSKIKGGDIALMNGHVMLYIGRSGSKYAFFEADASDSKVSYNTYTARQLSGYEIYKFKGFSD